MRIKDLFSLSRISGNVFRSQVPGECTLRSYGRDERGHLVYGGHTVAQSIVAAWHSLSAHQSWHVTNYSGYFVRAGDLRLPIDYTVQRLGGAHTRTGIEHAIVEACQDGQLLTRATMVYERRGAADDDRRQRRVPVASACGEGDYVRRVPPPDGLLDAAVIRRRARAAGIDTRRLDDSWKTFHMRPVNQSAEAMLRPAPSRELWWLRAPSLREPWSAMETSHRAVMAYMSDVLMQIIIRMHEHEARTLAGFHASLDHAISWHKRSCSATDWLLYDVTSPIAHGGRSFARGELRTSDGELVATVAQEAAARYTQTAKRRRAVTHIRPIH